MEREYKVTRHVTESTAEEKEEVYKEIANLFTRIALKEKSNQK